MARTVELRTVESYMRDVKTLLRLRTAIMIDTSLDGPRRNEAVECLDKVIKLVQTFSSELK